MSLREEPVDVPAGEGGGVGRGLGRPERCTSPSPPPLLSSSPSSSPSPPSGSSAGDDIRNLLRLAPTVNQISTGEFR